MPPILLIAGLVALVVVGFFFVRRIPKGGAHRRKPKSDGQDALQTPYPTEPEPGGDWFSASSFNAIPQLEFLVRAAREGGKDSISMVGVFDRMVEGAARTQALESADRFSQRMFESGASPKEVVEGIKAAAGSAQNQQPTARRKVQRGPDDNPYGVQR